ncbi:hypothetical protein HanHA300_Chr05g0174521 [Helianthus annuus]|nr:hypothetical protein HanHA300_Chr05g0174521 [Helianthus annuus]KAJ0584459.1 hypothetical protein HanHA89_Chr05g0188901 [Helianthus annuus]
MNSHSREMKCISTPCTYAGNYISATHIWRHHSILSHPKTGVKPLVNSCVVIVWKYP